MTGGLYDPLGTGRDAPARARVLPSAPVTALGLLLAALAALFAVSYLRDTGDRGLPVAVAPIERLPPPPPAPPTPAAPPLPAPAPVGPPSRLDEDVQIENGVRVVRPRREVPAFPPAAAPALPQNPPSAPRSPPPSTQGGAVLRVPDGKAVR